MRSQDEKVMRTGLIFWAVCISSGAFGADENRTDDEIPRIYVGKDEFRTPISKIVNGNPAAWGKYKSQAMVFRNGYFICGGTVLDTFHILTAAHCVVDEIRARRYLVAVGKHYMQSDAGSDQILRVAALVYHNNYDLQTSANDIAILTLKQPVVFNDYVLPVVLADSTAELSRKCYASGFGLVGQEPEELASRLQELRTTVISKRKCLKKARAYGVESYITDKVMCTRDKRAGVCSGDSGGPLGCFRGGSYVQFGILSFGSSICERGFNVYTRVSEYISWINNNTA